MRHVAQKLASPSTYGLAPLLESCSQRSAARTASGVIFTAPPTRAKGAARPRLPRLPRLRACLRRGHPGEMWIEDPDGIRIVLVEVPVGHPLRRDLRSA
jgi:hypothetical protein